MAEHAAEPRPRSRSGTATTDEVPIEWSPAPHENRFGRFAEKLGEGATKIVYRGVDWTDGKLVAWNEVSTSGLSEEDVERVRAEIRLLEDVHHDRVMDCYGSWVTSEKIVFITGICESGDLARFNKAHAVKLKIIKKWCRQILAGVAYLHGFHPPIIHRDLKCENILYNASDGTVRIGDLGLCTKSAGDGGGLCGTPSFMAPEMYDGQIGTGIDVYAFGMCVLEMVTKRLPYYECTNVAQIFRKVTQGLLPDSFARIKHESVRDFIRFCVTTLPTGERPSAVAVLAHPFLDDALHVLEDDETELVWPEATDAAVSHEELMAAGGLMDVEGVATMSTTTHPASHNSPSGHAAALSPSAHRSLPGTNSSSLPDSFEIDGPTPSRRIDFSSTATGGSVEAARGPAEVAQASAAEQTRPSLLPAASDAASMSHADELTGSLANTKPLEFDIIPPPLHLQAPVAHGFGGTAFAASLTPTPNANSESAGSSFVADEPPAMTDLDATPSAIQTDSVLLSPFSPAAALTVIADQVDDANTVLPQYSGADIGHAASNGPGTLFLDDEHDAHETETGNIGMLLSPGPTGKFDASQLDDLLMSVSAAAVAERARGSLDIIRGASNRGSSHGSRGGLSNGSGIVRGSSFGAPTLGASAASADTVPPTAGRAAGDSVNSLYTHHFRNTPDLPVNEAPAVSSNVSGIVHPQHLAAADVAGLSDESTMRLSSAEEVGAPHLRHTSLADDPRHNITDISTPAFGARMAVFDACQPEESPAVSGGAALSFASPRDSVHESMEGADLDMRSAAQTAPAGVAGAALSDSANSAPAANDALERPPLLQLCLSIDYDSTDDESALLNASVTFEFDPLAGDAVACARDVVASLVGLDSFAIDEGACVPMIAAFIGATRFEPVVSLSAGPIPRLRWRGLSLKNCLGTPAAATAPDAIPLPDLQPAWHHEHSGRYSVDSDLDDLDPDREQHALVAADTLALDLADSDAALTSRPVILDGSVVHIGGGHPLPAELAMQHHGASAAISGVASSHSPHRRGVIAANQDDGGSSGGLDEGRRTRGLQQYHDEVGPFVPAFDESPESESRYAPNSGSGGSSSAGSFLLSPPLVAGITSPGMMSYLRPHQHHLLVSPSTFALVTSGFGDASPQGIEPRHPHNTLQGIDEMAGGDSEP